MNPFNTELADRFPDADWHSVAINMGHDSFILTAVNRATNVSVNLTWVRGIGPFESEWYVKAYTERYDTRWKHVDTHWYILDDHPDRESALAAFWDLVENIETRMMTEAL